MIALAWALLLWVSGPALAAPPAFDEAAAKHLYEGFMIAWSKPLELESYRKLSEAHGPVPEVGAWPIDPVRGVLLNDVRTRPASIAWELEGVDQPIDPPPANFDWVGIATVDDAFLVLTPKRCVPEACYFESPRVGPVKKPIVNKPGFWIALREHRGRWVIAGILMHRTAPKDPLAHPLFVKWKTELATRFPLAPTPP